MGCSHLPQWGGGAEVAEALNEFKFSAPSASLLLCGQTERLQSCSAMMRPARIHVERIKTLRCRDEKAIPFRATEAEIADGFGKLDLTDTFALRIENVDAIVASAHPTRAGPEVAFDIAADAVGTAFASSS